MAIKSYPKNDSTKLSANFKVSEFACKGKGCCSTVKVDSELVAYLQQIRDHFGVAVTINSGYRCATHNKAVGGATGSQHTKGTAADIVVKGIPPAEVAKYAESIGILGIGLYETSKDGYFVHIDTRTKKSFWYGQAEAYRSTFGGLAIPTLTTREWQVAAIADGFKFPRFGADGKWGAECEAVAAKAICQKLLIGYHNKNLTRLVQEQVGFVGADVDGKFGKQTKAKVEAWQAANNLPVTGKIGPADWRTMLGV